jgi:hypothetical protein
MSPVEVAVRAMTRAQRVAYLRAAGWHRLSSHGSQTWLAPGWHRHPRGHVEPGQDRGFYTLAAAIRMAIGAAQSTTDPRRTP